MKGDTRSPLNRNVTVEGHKETEDIVPLAKRYASDARRQGAYRERQAEARRLELSRKGLPDLPVIPTMPGNSRWEKMLEEAGALVRMVVEEREAYHDERSEAWQASDKGEAFAEVTDAIRGIVEALEELD